MVTFIGARFYETGADKIELSAVASLTNSPIDYPIRPLDLSQIVQSAQEVVRLHLRAGDVVPAHDGEFVDRLRGGVASEELDVARDDLDVEDPARDERAGEDFAQRVVAAEDFSAALRVVDGQSEAGRDERRADAADVVPGGTAADLASEEPDARAHHDLDFLSRFENRQEAGELAERS